MANWVLIPARSGSKGVVDKNIKKLNGKPVLQYTILSARQICPVTNIFLSTDSKKYAEIAKKSGIQIHMRHSFAAGDNATDDDVILDFIYSNNISEEDVIIYLRPTTPLRNSDALKQAMHILPTLFEDKKFNSVRSGHIEAETAYKSAKKAAGAWESLMADTDASVLNLPRQHYPETYSLNGFFDATKVSAVLKSKEAFPGEMMAYTTGPILEIDSEFDFDILEAYIMYKNGDSNGKARKTKNKK